MSTYCFVAASKLLLGSEFNINAPVIVPPVNANLPFKVVITELAKLASLFNAAASSFNVFNACGELPIKLLTTLLTYVSVAKSVALNPITPVLLLYVIGPLALNNDRISP